MKIRCSSKKDMGMGKTKRQAEGMYGQTWLGKM